MDTSKWPITRRTGYTAALIDGEGTVTLLVKKAEWDTRRRRTVDHITPCVHIQMADRAPLDALHDWWGGSLWTTKYRPVAHWRRMWHWRIQGQPAVQMLRFILGFLMVKSDVADVVLEYADSVQNHTGGRPSAEELSHRKQFVARVRKLNRQ
jgi:hypothetical protein